MKLFGIVITTDEKLNALMDCARYFGRLEGLEGLDGAISELKTAQRTLTAVIEQRNDLESQLELADDTVRHLIAEINGMEEYIDELHAQHAADSLGNC